MPGDVLVFCVEMGQCKNETYWKSGIFGMWVARGGSDVGYSDGFKESGMCRKSEVKEGMQITVKNKKMSKNKIYYDGIVVSFVF
jgi:hypothetical protein